MASRSSRVEDSRAKLLGLLCSGDRTTSELAHELAISANAVREHLGRLEADGSVEYRVVRRGVGKPAHLYRLTLEGSRRLSRAYLPLLTALLAVARDRLGANEEEALLRDAGRALALQYRRPAGSLRQRADAAVALLGELGGISALEEADGELRIQGLCCPVRALVAGCPQVCKAVETLLSEFISAPVYERCEKHDPPSCHLVIGTAEQAEERRRKPPAPAG